MPPDNDPISIRQIYQVVPFLAEDHLVADDRRKRRHQNPAPEKHDVGKHFLTLAKAVEAANEELVKNHRPYRFCVYKEKGEIFIDFVVLNEQGKIISTKKKNISKEDFARLIEDVSKIEGLLVDFQS